MARNPWKKMVNNMSQQERAEARQNLGASDPAAARRVQVKEITFNPNRYVVTSTYREPITEVVASRGGFTNKADANRLASTLAKQGLRSYVVDLATNRIIGDTVAVAGRASQQVYIGDSHVGRSAPRIDR